MKKKLLTLLLVPFLIGCTQPKSKYPKYVLNSPWGEEKATAMYDTFHAMIPYMEADEHEFEYTVDEYGDDMLCAYFYYGSDQVAEAKVDEYAELCYSKGYDVESTIDTFYDWDNYVVYEYEVVYASKVIKDSIGFEMQFLASRRNGNACLGVFAYNYVYCAKDAWPTAAVEHLLGDRASLVPALNESGRNYKFLYDVDSKTGSICLEIQVTNGYYSDEETYFNLLKAKGVNQAQLDDLDDEYFKVVDTYEPFDDQFYYMTYLAEDIMVLYDYSTYHNAFIVDIWLIKSANQ